MGPEPTRRDLLRDGLGIGAGALAGAGLTALVGGAEAALAAISPAEARALNYAVQIEQVLLLAYRQVIASDLLTPAVRRQLRTMMGQEVQHLGLLTQALTGRGEVIPTPPTVAGAQAVLTRHQVNWSLTHLLNQHDCLKLLVDVESLSEGAYFAAIGELSDVRLARMCAEIMACEAQHWTVLSGLLNHKDAKKAVPYPFVEGTP